MTTKLAVMVNLSVLEKGAVEVSLDIFLTSELDTLSGQHDAVTSPTTPALPWGNYLCYPLNRKLGWLGTVLLIFFMYLFLLSSNRSLQNDNEHVKRL
jgi:hypothetical protein